MKNRTAHHPIMVHSIQLITDLIGNDSSLQMGFNFNQTIDQGQNNSLKRETRDPNVTDNGLIFEQCFDADFETECDRFNSEKDPSALLSLTDLQKTSQTKENNTLLDKLDMSEK